MKGLGSSNDAAKQELSLALSAALAHLPGNKSLSALASLHAINKLNVSDLHWRRCMPWSD